MRDLSVTSCSRQAHLICSSLDLEKLSDSISIQVVFASDCVSEIADVRSVVEGLFSGKETRLQDIGHFFCKIY